ncbi:MAG: GNAT family N-acetyltransferase [Anaerolineae bacterium]|nr:GNAT family N-acetyltransferase [Anaerolineae bacterium]
MNAEELIRIHLELECVGIDEDGDLYRIPCAAPDDLPRFYIAHYKEGYSRHFRQDLPAQLREQLLALMPDIALEDSEAVRIILAEDAPCHDFHTGKGYVFPDHLPVRLYPDATLLTETHRAFIECYAPGMNVADKAVYAVITGGQIVSTCESSRENEHAGEAWVQTLPAFRGRGYARQVTAAWANHLQQQDKIPFYSHKLNNLASQRVAQGLKLIQYITDAGYI